MKNVKIFNDINAYNAFTLILPNISLIKDTYEIKYNKFIHNYSDDYFTIECTQSGKLKFGPEYNSYWQSNIFNSSNNGTYYIKISNDGETWTDITTDFDSEEVKYEFDMQAGDKVMISTKLLTFDNINNKYDFTYGLTYDVDEPQYKTIDTSPYKNNNEDGQFIIYGNLRSLFFGDDFLSSYEYDNNTFDTNISLPYRPLGYFLGNGILSTENLICDMPISYRNFIYFANDMSIGPTFIINYIRTGILAELIASDYALNSIKILGNISSEDLYTLIDRDNSSILSDGNDNSENNVIIYKSPEATFEKSAVINGNTEQILPNNYIIQNIS